MAIKNWERVKKKGLTLITFWRKDGVEITNYNTTTKYPFIQIQEEDNSYIVRLITTSYTQDLSEFKTKKEAFMYIKKYMENN